MSETPSPTASLHSRPKGVRAVRTRRADGTESTYWYCRLTGARLPDIADPSFAIALASVRGVQAASHAAGTLGALLLDWRRSREWAETAQNTRTNRDRYLAAIEVPKWSARQAVDLPPAELRRLRADLLDMRDAIAEARGSGAATVFGQSVASLFAWAVDRGRMAISPLTQLRSLPGGHIPAWTESDARHAMTAWPEPVRRAVVLAFHIGQRKGDLALLRWDAYDPGAGTIVLQPEKTRRYREAKGKPPLRLIVTSALAWELRRWRESDPDGTHILTRADGRPWSKSALSTAVRLALVKERWPTKRGLHGLRRLRAEMLLESGSSDGEIAAAQGWDSLRTVHLYTEGADQEKMARAAVGRLEKVVSKSGKSRR